MKRDFYTKTIIGKTNTGSVLIVANLLAGGVAWAHPGVAEHAAVNGPAHGMVHAVMAAPEWVAGGSIVLLGLVSVLRFIRRSPGASAWRRRA